MKNRKEVCILLIATIIIPLIPLLFLYNQNKAYLNLEHVFMVFGVLSALYVIVFVLMTLIYKSAGSAFAICVWLTLPLFSVNKIYSMFISLQGMINIRFRYFFIALIIVIIASSFAIGYFAKKVDVKIISVVSIVMTGVLLVFNLMPIIITAFSARLIHADQVDSAYKKEYVIDDNTETPNVYWFLCDGMLGIEATEECFGDLSELTQNLEERGFQINPSASLETDHTTMIAIAALMCPDYYDTFLENNLSDHDSAVALKESPWFSSDEFHDVLRYNEFIAAFENKGYKTNTIALSEWYFYPTTDKFYVVTHHNDPTEETLTSVPYILEDSISNTAYQSQAISLAKMLAGGIGEKFASSIYSGETNKKPLKYEVDNAAVLLGSEEASKYYLPLVSSLNDSLCSVSEDYPQLTVIHDLMAHSPYCFDEYGNLIDVKDDIFNFYSHYKYSAKVLLNMIDMIIEKDPEAVIILQADHGTSISAATWLEDEINESEEFSIYVYNSVLSAIRVPEQFQTGEEKFALSNPLNMSRYAVNTFVGDNYKYIEE